MRSAPRWSGAVSSPGRSTSACASRSAARGQRSVPRRPRRRRRPPSRRSPPTGARRRVPPPSPPPSWLDRLDIAIGRFRDHLARDHPGRTDPVPGEDETWDDRQVWAHVAEFGDYWLAELTRCSTADVDRPGAVRAHPPRRRADRRHRIRPRTAPPTSTCATIERSADRLAALLAGMTDEDWDRSRSA